MENTKEKQKILRELQRIPSIGKACALDLWNIGIRCIPDLEGQNPRLLYERLNAYSGVTQDICMLYTFRCAVYFATETSPEENKLKWWYWKDKALGNEEDWWLDISEPEREALLKIWVYEAERMDFPATNAKELFQKIVASREKPG